jgi:hypothetical protein
MILIRKYAHPRTIISLMASRRLQICAQINGVCLKATARKSVGCTETSMHKRMGGMIPWPLSRAHSARKVKSRKRLGRESTAQEVALESIRSG